MVVAAAAEAAVAVEAAAVVEVEGSGGPDLPNLYQMYLDPEL